MFACMRVCACARVCVRVRVCVCCRCTHAESWHMLLVGVCPSRQGLLYALMLLEGVGVLFPWNAFITVTEYFSTKLAGSDFEVCLCV